MLRPSKTAIRSSLAMAVMLLTLAIGADPGQAGAAAASGELAQYPGAHSSELTLKSNTVVTHSLHVNMMGLVGGGSNYGSRMLGIEYVVQKLNSNSYLSISLNEVCPQQVAEIARRITTSYTNVYWAAYDAPASAHKNGDMCTPPGARKEYGNAIFQKFGLVSLSAHRYSVSDSASSPDRHVYRNILCLKTAYFLLGYWGCSTHLSPNAGSYVAQRNELAFIMAAYNSSSTAMHIMGDLNSNRHPHLTAIHSAFTEADINNPKRATGDGGGPIDYIFGRSVSSVYVNQAISADLVWTDHRAIAGYFRSPY